MSGVTPKSHLASMTSKPLFMRVAESIVILAPMFHVGWARASSLVTWASCSFVKWRNGPPLHVRSILSILLPGSMHWNMAECSESTGRMGTWCSLARRVMRSPATTSVSLLAKAMAFFALMAAMVGSSPAKPTMEASTMSTLSS